MSFYLFRTESVQGPYSEAELQDMLKHGEIGSDILACKEGDSDWIRLDVCLGKKPPTQAPKQFYSSHPAHEQTQQKEDSPSSLEAIKRKFKTKSPEEAIQAIYKQAAGYMKAGKSNQDVEDLLVGDGLSYEEASAIIANISKALRSAAKQTIVIGAAFFILGTIATVGGFLYSGSTGGRFMVFYGAVLFGLIRLVTGIFQYSKIK